MRPRPSGPGSGAGRSWSCSRSGSPAGRQLGLFHVLYRILPGLNWFRVPARSLFLTSLGMAILAGFGLEVLRRRLVGASPWRWFAFRLARTACVVVCLLLLVRQAGLLVGSEPDLGTPGKNGSARLVNSLDRLHRAGRRVWTGSSAIPLSGSRPRRSARSLPGDAFARPGEPDGAPPICSDCWRSASWPGTALPCFRSLRPASSSGPIRSVRT